ncbi:hypothetical protein BO85DRAFT_80438 [Aspergillus piperis CBS 112811]|uniref:Uncharacterized protein n=1 Tax=Aspergillus piperis CBS 112811 TaxID=1448313 RepID=A0A8G1QX19_9EURO|nr:hypothetical protein BO85DRAFT_80438 [Aspergillus piperis CBS 112811]RAH55142.1 hypothetical protein BO85DRAFT_80438 [Aspergillus piperis CBS 112811]
MNPRKERKRERKRKREEEKKEEEEREGSRADGKDCRFLRQPPCAPVIRQRLRLPTKWASRNIIPIPKHRSRGCHPGHLGIYRVAGSLLPSSIHISPIITTTCLLSNAIFYTPYSDRTHCTQFSTCSQTGNPEKWPDRDGLFSANDSRLIPSLVSVTHALVLMGPSD